MQSDDWGVAFWMIRLHGEFEPTRFTPEYLGDRGALTEKEVSYCDVSSKPTKTTIYGQPFDLAITHTMVEVTTSAENGQEFRLPEVVRHLIRFRNKMPIYGINLVWECNWRIANPGGSSAYLAPFASTVISPLTDPSRCVAGSTSFSELIDPRSTTVLRIEPDEGEATDLLVTIEDEYSFGDPDPSVAAAKAIDYLTDCWPTFRDRAPLLADAVIGRPSAGQTPSTVDLRDSATSDIGVLPDASVSADAHIRQNDR